MELPATMKAAVCRGPGRLVVEERPLPETGAGEVLLRVSHCGVCGTDLHLVLDGWGRPDTIGGHEYSGHVVKLGDAVTGWRPGDAVVVVPEATCGRCAWCRAGRPSLCDGKPAPGAPYQGAFAEYARVGAGQLVAIPPGLPPRVAALAEPLAVALHAVSRSGVAPGGRALVTGAGPIGMLVLAALRARGVEDVVVSEPAPARRARAEALGARRVLEPEALAYPRLPFESVPEPCDVAFECSGRPRAFSAALASLGKGGGLVVVGTGMERPKLDAHRVLLNELQITGAYNYDANGLADALGLLAGGAIPVDLLIEPEDVPLSGLLGAMQRLAAGEVAGKLLVAPAAEE